MCTSDQALHFSMYNILILKICCFPIEKNNIIEAQEEELTIDLPIDNSNVRINR